MAQQPDGKPASTERVTFTRPAAQRIARVVRTVESGDRTQKGLSFQHSAISSGIAQKTIRAATFTGSWSIGTAKVVSFSQAPTATATVTNLTWPLDEASPSTQNCLVGKEGTNWWLIVPALEVISCDTKATAEQLSFFSG